jgi:gamma-glutamylcyclotransferase (GGCT)/AIG2-like uncharacterized protein YtfP
MNEYLFVYGLFRDSGNSLLKGSKYCGRTTIEGRIYYVNEFYPGFIRQRGYKTWGDVYLIDKNLFLDLDEYEGDEYKRTKIVTDSDIECWIYEYKFDVSGFKEIKSGDWMLRKI